MLGRSVIVFTVEAHKNDDGRSLEGPAIGKRVRLLRDAHGLSASELGRRIGKNHSYILQLEGGQIDDPGIATVLKLAEALNTTVTFLLGHEDLEHDAEAEARHYRLLEYASTLSEGTNIPAVEVAELLEELGELPPQDQQFVVDLIRRLVGWPKDREGG